jgi:hypothetical protein
MNPLIIATPGQDNTAALKRALLDAKAQGRSVFIPAGVWAYSDCLDVEGEFYGDGDESVLFSLNPERAAIFLRGNGAKVHHLRLSGVPTGPRKSNLEVKRVVVSGGAINFAVEDLLIDTGQGAGIFMTGVSWGTIARNRITNTLADSIHITGISSHILLEHNEAWDCGDDGIAVVSYQAQNAPCHHITARHNKIRDQRSGRGMSVIGGEDILYEHNFVDNNIHAAGMILARESGAYITFAPQRVTLRRNTIRNCGNRTIGHRAIHMSVAGTEFTGNEIVVSRNVIHQDDVTPTGVGGIRVSGQWANVALDQNVVAANEPYSIKSPTGVTKTAYISGPIGA